MRALAEVALPRGAPGAQGKGVRQPPGERLVRGWRHARVWCRGSMRARIAPHIATRRSRPIARMTRTEVTLAVDFACEGCAASVRRIAERIEGVREVEIDVEAKRCVVRGDALDAEDVLARVRKCGRATTLLME